MPFRDWEQVTALELPMYGKTYTVPPMAPAALLDINLTREAAARGEQVDVSAEADEKFLRQTLGAALDVMRADLPKTSEGGEHPAIVRAAYTALTDAEIGRDAAEYMWEHGPSPEALAAGMAAAAEAASKRSTSNPSKVTRSTNGSKPHRRPSSAKKTPPRSPGRK